VVLDLSCRLLRGPFGLRLGVAGHLADSHLDGTLYLVSAADDPIFVMSWVVFLVNTRSRLKVPKNIRMVDAAMVRGEFRQLQQDLRLAWGSHRVMTWIWLSTIVVLVGGKLNAEIERKAPPARRSRWAGALCHGNQ
jgi:hypothetical protein